MLDQVRDLAEREGRHVSMDREPDGCASRSEPARSTASPAPTSISPATSTTCSTRVTGGPGLIRLLDRATPGAAAEVRVELASVYVRGEGGLMGLVLDVDIEPA